MLKLTDEQKAALAAALPTVPDDARASLRSIYDRFEAERALRQPRCDRSGACCRFEAFGHRLFVTTIELAAFEPAIPPRADFDGTGCPYQVDGLCAAHAVRPFGCRAFFCDRSSDDWQQTQYERFHAELRELHERFGVPYAYVEWREGLEATGQATPKPTDAVAGRRVALTVRPDGR